MSSQKSLLATLFLLTAAVIVPAPAEAVPTFGNYGTFVKAGDRDHAYVLQTIAAIQAGADAFLAMRELGAAGTTDNAYYIHFGVAAGQTTVPQDNAFRLLVGTGGTGTAGTWVTSGSTDIGANWLNPDGSAYSGAVALAALIKYVEADGHNGWSLGDLLFIDIDGNGLEAGDIRLSALTTPSVQAFTMVGAADADVAEAGDGDDVFPISAAALGTFVLRVYEARNDARVDRNDIVFFKETATVTGTTLRGGANALVLPEPGDFCLAPTGGPVTPTCGIITSTNTVVKPFLFREAPTLVCTNCAAVDITTRNLYLHFPDPDGVDDRVLMNDIVIFRGSTTIGTRVNSVSNGYGEVIDVTTANAASLLFFMEIDGVPGLTTGDGVYLDRPAGMGGTAGTCAGTPACLSEHDIRFTSVATGGTTFTAGSRVATGNSDLSALGTTNPASYGFHFKTFDTDRQRAIPLQTMSGVAVAGADALWDPATEGLYVGSGTVTNGITRLFHPALATPSVVACPGDADCAAAITAVSNVKVTGADTTFTAAQSEYVYWSNDAFVNAGDRRVTANGAFAKGTTVAMTGVAGDADIVGPWSQSSTDLFFFSLDAGCPATCFPSIRPFDVRGSTFGTFVKDPDADLVPRVVQVTTDTLVRNNRGDQSSTLDDTFYYSTSAAAPLRVGDVRTTARDTLAAGTFVGATDTADLQGQNTFDGGRVTALLNWIDNDAVTGWTIGDIAMINTPAALGGQADAVPQRNDIRVNDYTVGTTAFKAGTLLQTGNLDASTYTAFTAVPAGYAWRTFFADLNNDGALNDADQLYFAFSPVPPQFGPAAPPVITMPTLLWIRASGSGGTTTTAAPLPPPPPPPPPPTNNPATIAISAPASGAFVMTGATVQVSGTASGGTTNNVANSISSVALTVNGSPVTVTGTTSWTASFQATSNGTYTLVATVTPSSGSPVSTQTTVTANPTGVAPPSPPPTTPPTTTEQQLATLLTQNTALSVQLNTTLTQNQALQTQVANLSTQISTQTQQVSTLNSQLQSLQTENARLRAELAGGGNQTGGNGTPGFEPLLALAALAVALLARRRRG